MPTSTLALARERLKTIAETISGLSSRCAVLSTLDDAEAESWRRFAPGDFAFLAVCESSKSFAGIDAPTAVNVCLYRQAESADAEAIDDLVMALKTAWEDAANYPDGELACSGVTFDPYQARIAEPGRAFLRVHFICYFPEPN